MNKSNHLNHTIMKKFLLLLFLAMPLISFAQKSRIFLWFDNSAVSHTLYVSGAITTSHSKVNKKELGNYLNLYSEKGYDVEQMTTDENNSVYIIMAKGSSAPTEVQTIKRDEDSEVYEVARYNLQGLPVKKHEKGVQIVVFSNYTTKTIIVE